MSAGGRTIAVEIGPDPPARLDKALARDVPEGAELSRSRLVRLIEEGCVLKDGAVLDSPKTRVAAGDRLEIQVPEPADVALVPEAIPLDVVHEDADLIVVNKAAGMVVHPAPGSPSGTLVNALLHHFGGALSGVGGEKRPGIVHRNRQGHQWASCCGKVPMRPTTGLRRSSKLTASRGATSPCAMVSQRASDPRAGWTARHWLGGKHPTDRD